MRTQKTTRNALLAAAATAAGLMGTTPAGAQMGPGPEVTDAPVAPPASPGVETSAPGVAGAPDPSGPADIAGGKTSLPDLFAEKHRFSIIPTVVAERYPTRFAGGFIDRETGGDPVLHIRVKGLTEKERAELASEIGDPAIVVEASDFSRADLDAQQDGIEAELFARDITKFTTGLDLELGVVNVYLEETDAPRFEGVVEAYNRSEDNSALANRIRLGVLPTLDIAFVESASQFPPMRGGKFLQVGGAENCTSAFSIWNQAFGYFSTTAGHCGDQGGSIHMQNTFTFVSNAAADFAPTNGTTSVDAMTFPLSEANASPTIMNDGGTVRPVWFKIADASLTPNLQLCKVGQATGTTCGPITDVGITVSDGSLTVTDLVCMSAAADYGDSGGPVEQPRDGGGVWAAGTISAKYFSKTCFTTIDRVLNAAYSQIVTQPK